MQIRIIIRSSTVGPEDIRQAVWNFSKHVRCLLTGHESEIELGSGKLSLKCRRCGWHSPGWTLDRRFAPIDGESHRG